MRQKRVKELSRLLLEPRDRQELETLLQGLLTPRELEEITNRWRLMVMLLEGRTQRDISHDLGISLGKIARGSRLLKYGPHAFRRLVVRILDKHKNEEKDPKDEATPDSEFAPGGGSQ